MDQQQSVGEQTLEAATNNVAPRQDQVAAIPQQPLGMQGVTPPGGSDAPTAAAGGAGAGDNITVGPRPGLQVMGATPSGIMCTMSPEVWQQLMQRGLLNIQASPAEQQQQQLMGQHAPAGLQQPQPGPSGLKQPQPGPSGLQPLAGPSGIQQRGPAGMRPIPYLPKGGRPTSGSDMSEGEWWEIPRTSRSTSWAESGITGIILIEIRAEYDLTNYPFDSQVKFVIYTYVEVNGVRRLLKIRSIPE